MNSVAGYEAVASGWQERVEAEEQSQALLIVSIVFLFFALAARITISHQLTDVGYQLQRAQDVERQLIDERQELQLEMTRFRSLKRLKSRAASQFGLYPAEGSDPNFVVLTK